MNEGSTPSKILLFLSHQIIHKIHKGTSFQNMYIPVIIEPSLPRSQHITVFGITHDTLNKANTRNHNSQAIGQRSKRCSTVSSPILQQHQSIDPKTFKVYGFSTN